MNRISLTQPTLRSELGKMEAPLLHGGGGGDYPPMRSWREVRSMVWAETVKLWRVAGPLAFQILCQFGTNSITTVFVSHIGNLELSAVSISLCHWNLRLWLPGWFPFLFLCFVAEKRRKEKKKKKKRVFDFYVICFCYCCHFYTVSVSLSYKHDHHRVRNLKILIVMVVDANGFID